MSEAPPNVMLPQAVRRGREQVGVTQQIRNWFSPELEGITEYLAFMAMFAGHPPTVYKLDSTRLSGAGLEQMFIPKSE